MRKDKNTICNDEPSAAEKYQVQIELGDVIITATDGVYDNLFNREILEIIESYKRERYETKQEGQEGGPPC